MTGDDLRRMRERRGLTRDELAGAINHALGKSYTGESIARWERGREPSKAVRAFLEELAVSSFGDELAGDTPPAVDELEPELDPATGADEPPGPGPTVTPQPPVTTGGGAYVKACEELWEMIATGVGMMGAVLNSPALVNDGAIIAADKEALGAAWGKLAQTNDTFRRMLVGMTEGGAWLQVALVTGTTFSKCWQGHAMIAAHVREQRPQPVEPTDGPVDRDHLAEAS